MSDYSSSGVQPGDVLAGKYRVERVLGEGGMGIVVAAHNLQLDRMVALKFLLPLALKSPEAVARFIREARTAAKITSEHVARVSDVGQLENGAPYMVMEYLEGGDLDAWLKQRGALPIEQAIEFVLHACVAVADAHALGIVHRDLKPANLFCVRRSDGQLSIKVVDFGISKLTTPGAASVAMTKTSAVMGTPLYMSPEQMQSSKTVDARTDIWALGVILYELIAGRVPFLADSVMELAVKIATEAPPSLRSFRPDVSPALEAVIAKCLQKDAAKRYRNVGELAVALVPFAPKRAKASVERISGIIQSSGLSESALAVPPSPQASPANVTPGTLQAVGQTVDPAPPRTSAAIGGVVVALLVVAGVAAYFLFPRGSTGHAETPVLAATSSAATEAPTPTATAMATVTTTATVTATATATEPTRPATATEPTRPASHGTTHSTSSHTSTTPPSAPQPAAPSCDPPFTLNAAGHRVHKPECP